MREMKGTEISEVKKPEADNFKEIKPRTEMTAEEARGVWKEKFSGNDESDVKENLDVLVKNCIEDLKSRSDCPETISDDVFKASDLEVQSAEKVGKVREEFENQKEELRKQWEEKHGEKWPRYTCDVPSPKNPDILLRKAGDYYDMHHLQPTKLGGKNEVDNITPLHVNEHMAIHVCGGSCKILVDNMGGK